MIYTTKDKVTCSLTAIQRPGHWADNCKMVYYFKNVLLLMNSNEDAYIMQLKLNFPQWQS